MNKIKVFIGTKYVSHILLRKGVIIRREINENKELFIINKIDKNDSKFFHNVYSKNNIIILLI